MRLILLVLFSLSIVVFSDRSASAQNNNIQNEEVTADADDDIIRKVRFNGNQNVSTRSLRTLVRTRTNREFLGIRGFTPWYYIWRAFGVGESPSILDRETVANDIERITIFYENLGFFEAEVDTNIIEYRPNRFEVSFLIDEGPGSSIKSVSYTGLPDFENERANERFYSESIFEGTMLDDSTFQVNRQYLAQELRQEQSRVINFLKNNGYAAVQRDSVRALVKKSSENPRYLDILFAINSGELYHFGDVHINLLGPEGEDNYDLEKTLEGPPHTESGFSIYMRMQSDAQTKFELLHEQVQFTPGQLFNQSLYLRTINAYQNLGNVLTNRFGLSEDSSVPDYSKSEIPVYFDLQTLPKHSIRAEFFGMRRYGFGTGIGLNYNNNNLFGKSENFTLGVNTSLEFVSSRTLREIAPRDTVGRRTSSGSTIFQSYEVRAEYAIPRLNFPFGGFLDRGWVESGRTRYTLAYSQSNQLFFDINSDIRFNLRYEFRHSERIRSFLDLVEMDVVDTNPSTQFRQNLINEFGEDSFEFLRIEEDFRPQFSSIIRYTYRDQNTNLIKRDEGSFSEYSFALAGNVPYLIDRYLVTPGEIEGTLPSPFGISANDLAYSRFIKLSADHRRYYPISPNTTFAMRFFGGIAHPIGSNTTIPLNRRFFAGGSNDIRGWSPFRLGPGKISPDQVTIPGGEIKLSAYKEFRQIFLRDFFNANWQLAWHTDAGNIWYGPRNTFRDEADEELLEDGRFFFNEFLKQVAIGSGIGLRLDWEFIVARFDLTFRVHDLQEGWFEDRHPYFSFGIGHSF